jgi:hypothetical protein
LSIKMRTDQDDGELQILLEAARRATWDALHGPMHLRSGRFSTRREDGEEKGLGNDRPAAQRGDAPDDAPRRR